ncbi:hypothetical protein PROFUN_15022, partial [Planoprotostelium fungivorum]
PQDWIIDVIVNSLEHLFHLQPAIFSPWFEFTLDNVLNTTPLRSVHLKFISIMLRGDRTMRMVERASEKLMMHFTSQADYSIETIHHMSIICQQLSETCEDVKILSMMEDVCKYCLSTIESHNYHRDVQTSTLPIFIGDAIVLPSVILPPPSIVQPDQVTYHLQLAVERSQKVRLEATERRERLKRKMQESREEDDQWYSEYVSKMERKIQEKVPEKVLEGNEERENPQKTRGEVDEEPTQIEAVVDGPIDQDASIEPPQPPTTCHLQPVTTDHLQPVTTDVVSNVTQTRREESVVDGESAPDLFFLSDICSRATTETAPASPTFQIDASIYNQPQIVTTPGEQERRVMNEGDPSTTNQNEIPTEDTQEPPETQIQEIPRDDEWISKLPKDNVPIPQIVETLPVVQTTTQPPPSALNPKTHCTPITSPATLAPSTTRLPSATPTPSTIPTPSTTTVRSTTLTAHTTPALRPNVPSTVRKTDLLHDVRRTNVRNAEAPDTYVRNTPTPPIIPMNTSTVLGKRPAPIVLSAPNVTVQLPTNSTENSQETRRKVAVRPTKKLSNRPPIEKGITYDTIFQYYYKVDLLDYCHTHGLPKKGNIRELIQRILGHLNGKPVSGRTREISNRNCVRW